MSERTENRTPHKTYSLMGTDKKFYQSETPGTYGGHKKTKVYGRMDCPAAPRAIAKGGYVKERVFFADEQTAIKAGYRPCAACLPDKYKIWKAKKSGHPKSDINKQPE